ncbi:magnesium-dependent phosphatase 1 isoform X2 [Ptiloglossa arizonensis]|uniref:magnesium-dependent phosphatase 1 isoform X2 n=1 Tax=Ptiloglossa arizonensis TaxID=3350558 RepID=UPI003FA13D35
MLLFHLKSNDVVDAHGTIIRYYKDVPDILKQLSNEGYELGVASRTSEIQGAKQLLNLFNWDKYFKYKEIYPGSKVTHFSKIQKASGANYKDMLFFDDEHRNIVDVSQLGVTCIHVQNMTYTLVENALKNF